MIRKCSADTESSAARHQPRPPVTRPARPSPAPPAPGIATSGGRGSLRPVRSAAPCPGCRAVGNTSISSAGRFFFLYCYCFFFIAVIVFFSLLLLFFSLILSFFLYCYFCLYLLLFFSLLFFFYCYCFLSFTSCLLFLHYRIRLQWFTSIFFLLLLYLSFSPSPLSFSLSLPSEISFSIDLFPYIFPYHSFVILFSSSSFSFIVSPFLPSSPNNETQHPRLQQDSGKQHRL